VEAPVTEFEFRMQCVVTVRKTSAAAPVGSDVAEIRSNSEDRNAVLKRLVPL